jgi:signal transduction histidine kinase
VVRIEDATERARIQELMIQTEKMISVGGLAAGMAHEINNPLGIITQAAQNIERRVSPELPANRKAAEELGVSLEGIKAYFEKRQIPEFIGSIREASLRASRIIANMLQFSRCAGTTMQLASLGVIIEQALELAAGDYDLKKKFDFRSIEIIRDYAPDMPEVPMVPVEMEQVMLNLLKNAAQAMIVNPEDRRPRITLRLRREERYALIEVEDNGPGMDEDVRRRVFEPFFTTKEPGMGTGLGLSVSYMIVTQNHKGLMEVESKPGKGACFRVRLPLPKENIHE